MAVRGGGSRAGSTVVLHGWAIVARFVDREPLHADHRRLGMQIMQEVDRDLDVALDYA